MTIAALFFLAVGAVIVGGIGYGWGHTVGMAEGYRQGRAERADRRLSVIAGHQCRGEGVWPVGEAWDLPLGWSPALSVFDFEADTPA